MARLYNVSQPTVSRIIGQHRSIGSQIADNHRNDRPDRLIPVDVILTREQAKMKNIQIIDGAQNCTFSLFQATDEEFVLLFPEHQQDIQYAEDLASAEHQDEVRAALDRIWQRPIRKQDVRGIHGTLFYQLERYKKWYREKREDAVDPLAINQAQRRLFDTPKSTS
jgi:hypothetical protein